MNFPVTLGGDFILRMTDEELDRFSRQNKPYKFEKNPDGSLIVKELTHSLASKQNSEIIYQLTSWNKRMKLGECFDSNGGFYLPDKSLKSPDAAWISNERYTSLSASDRDGFFHICPDFVIELKSGSDSLKTLKSKMRMWISNGCRLAWLIDPKSETVYIYTKEMESIHNNFDQNLSGEPVLAKFEFVFSALRN